MTTSTGLHASCAVLALTRSRSDAAVPLVAAVAPVAAVPLGEKDDLREILRVLVAELRGRVDARGGTPRGVQIVTVLRVDDESLWMHGALDVPALVVIVV